MAEPGESNFEQLERKLDVMIREADDLVCLAADSSKWNELELHKIAVGQLYNRVSMVASLLLDRKPPNHIRRVS